jgi:hypothetical protein
LRPPFSLTVKFDKSLMRDHSPAVSPSQIAVFICSADSRRDVLERVLPSLFKYWHDCPYRIYIGRNSEYRTYPGVTSLLAKPSEWRIECLDQIAQIPETHLIFLLDDYLLRVPVDQNRVATFVAKAVDANLSYMRLLPLRKSLVERFVGWIRRPGSMEIQAIKEGRPFFSGLQIAIWKKAHFASLLKLQGSIWDFEHQSQPGISHYAITRSPPIAYSHLVEKGRWLPYASRLLRQAGLPSELGSRPIWPLWMHLRPVVDEARFLVLGYANH